MLSNHTGYETMIKNSGKIIHGLSTEPKEIATALHADGFISNRILQETYQLPEINQDKGRRLYTVVLGVVENYPHRYKDFIAVLQQNTHLYSELLEILNGHGELEQNSSLEPPASKRQRMSDSEQSLVSGPCQTVLVASSSCMVRYSSYLKDRYKQMSVLPDPDWPPAITTEQHYTNLALIERERHILRRAETSATMAIRLRPR